MILLHNDCLLAKEEGDGDELCSDSFPYKFYNEVWYKFTLAERTDKEDGDYNTGANASQEEAAEGTDASEKKGLNAVLNHKLEENKTMLRKADLKQYIKTYYPSLKKAAARKNPNLSPEELDSRMAKYQEVFKEFMGDFENCEFFAGENNNHLGTHLIVRWDNVTPYAYLPIDGVREVKY